MEKPLLRMITVLFQTLQLECEAHIAAGRSKEAIALCRKMREVDSIFLEQDPGDELFVPTAFQDDILKALDGKALRTDALANAVGSRSRLFTDPGGLTELVRHRRVSNHRRLGYYRPDSPPPELVEAIAKTAIRSA